MKRNLVIILVSMIAVMAMFASCADNDGDYAYESTTYLYSTIGTFAKDTDGSYKIDSDSGKTLYVDNYQRLLDSGFTDGQRVYAEFRAYSEAEQSGYTHVSVTSAYPVLEKGVISLTDDNAGDIGDDQVDMMAWWVSKTYLNIHFQIKTSATATHYINLVTVDSPKKQEDGYQYLELRHNLNGNRPLNYYYGVASFDVADYLADPAVKGFIIRVNTIDEGEKFIKYTIETTDNQERELTLSPYDEPEGYGRLAD